MSSLIAKLRSPLEKYGQRYLSWIKYGTLAVCTSVWFFALVDQVYTSAHVMKYLLMSLIILAIALI